MLTLFNRIHIGRLPDEQQTRKRLLELLDKLMAKLSTLAGTLNDLETVLNKVKIEVEKLKEQLGDVDIPADAQATLDRLSALGKTLDDLNPDV
jgi:chromosome segregation ATPase